MSNSASSMSSFREPTYYQLLGLQPAASPQAIRRAYRDLSKLYHPDTTELESAIATVKFQALNEAYATLSSPEKRLAYDYKIGYSRISVIRVGGAEVQMPNASSSASQSSSKGSSGGKSYSSNAYLDPTDRPLSAGELFALFILGITFAACLVLVVTMSLTKDDIAIDLTEWPVPKPVEQTVPLDEQPARLKVPFSLPSSASSSSTGPSSTGPSSTARPSAEAGVSPAPVSSAPVSPAPSPSVDKTTFQMPSPPVSAPFLPPRRTYGKASDTLPDKLPRDLSEQSSSQLPGNASRLPSSQPPFTVGPGFPNSHNVPFLK